jgi:DNA-binding Lrp family transcriptional regulator
MRVFNVRPLFIRIKCELGATYAVAVAISDSIEQTSEIYSTSGEYDLLAKFFLPDEESTGRFVNDRLHKIAGIRDTYTIVAFQVFADEKTDPLLRGE